MHNQSSGSPCKMSTFSNLIQILSAWARRLVHEVSARQDKFTDTSQLHDSPKG